MLNRDCDGSQCCCDRVQSIDRGVSRPIAAVSAVQPGTKKDLDIAISDDLMNIVQNPSGWGVDGRYSLGDVFHVFADEDGETNGGSVSTLMLFDGALSAAEVAALGGPEAAGTVPEPATAGLALLIGGALSLRRRSRHGL